MAILGGFRVCQHFDAGPKLKADVVLKEREPLGQKMGSLCQEWGSRSPARLYLSFMNTLCDTAPSRLQQNNLEIEQSAPAKRAGRIYKRILVGTDFSTASIPAFEQALKLAKQNGAELLIAHVAIVPSTISFMPPESYGAWEAHCRTEAEENIGSLLQKAHQQGVKAHMLLLEGLADDAIMEAAERLRVDLIVIGTHGRRGVSRFFMGSVAARLVSRARCAVLTARSCQPCSP
jgi:nucleotide-binding universal stress UspA family protein